MKTKTFNFILTIAIALSFLAGCAPKETPTTEAKRLLKSQPRLLPSQVRKPSPDKS